MSADIEVPLPTVSDARPLARWGQGPRTSIVVVLTQSVTVAPERLARRLPPHDERTDVIVVCAGKPRNMPALERALSSATFVYAAPDQTVGDLRELGMRQARGDIVVLIDGEQHAFTAATRDLQRMAQ